MQNARHLLVDCYIEHKHCMYIVCTMHTVCTMHIVCTIFRVSTTVRMCSVYHVYAAHASGCLYTAGTEHHTAAATTVCYQLSTQERNRGSKLKTVRRHTPLEPLWRQTLRGQTTCKWERWGRWAASASTWLLFSCHNTQGVPLDHHLAFVYIGVYTKVHENNLVKYF